MKIDNSLLDIEYSIPTTPLIPFFKGEINFYHPVSNIEKRASSIEFQVPNSEFPVTIKPRSSLANEYHNRLISEIPPKEK